MNKNISTLTILTLPVGILGILMRIRRFTKGLVVKSYRERYGGHAAVTRSLVSGLKRIGTIFNYNPLWIRQVGDIVVVLNNVYALRQIIKLKKKGKVKKILAGPNVINFPREFNHLIASSEIDICLVPSEEVRITYEEDSPMLRGRIKIWSAGVDETFWKPSQEKSKNLNVLVYWKNEPKEFNEKVESIVRQYGWNPIRIIYGKYSPEKFKDILDQSRSAIFLSRSESQGIALAEVWAMDVPTLVWDPEERVYQGRIYSSISAAPYLTAVTGRKWKKIADLERLLDDFENVKFEPRRWVLEHMTDTVSSEQLIRIIRTL